jgi:hypothetical protein
MSETATEPVVEPVADAPVADAVEPAAELGEAGKKALAAERAARKTAEKSAAELLARVQAFEDADKSETEKAAARAEAAEKRAAEAEAKAMRVEVADELNVPKELRKFLTATDEDSLRSQAEELLTAFTAATAASRTTPRPDPTQGAKPASAALPQLTSADADGMTSEQIIAARRAGQFDDLLRIKT